MQKAARGPEAAPRRGVYLRGEDRERVFFTLRAKGVSLPRAADLLKYTLREAWDLTARGPSELPELDLSDFTALLNKQDNE